MNRYGEIREHSLSACSYFYALNWFRENIVECQGIIPLEERGCSKLGLISITGYSGGGIPKESHLSYAIQ